MPESRDPAADEPLPPGSERPLFELPVTPDGRAAAYLCGHSLGPLPRSARDAVEQELARWARRGIEGYFEDDGWYGLADSVRPGLAHVVGAHVDEVTAMNGLTVNLHLLLAGFYRPHGRRTKVLVDEPLFPSDRYAVEGFLRRHGRAPEETLLRVGATADERASIRSPSTGDVEAAIRSRGEEIALVLLSGVNFLTGRAFDIGRLSRAAHDMGCVLGLDLAHAAGNIPLSLHDDGVDFATWCTYKYLNAGPGAVAAAFVHERHADLGPALPGWWGSDPEARFRELHADRFTPRRGAPGWQVSCPPVLGLVPLAKSLELFLKHDGRALDTARRRLVHALDSALEDRGLGDLPRLTPAVAEERGAMTSLALGPIAARLREGLLRRGVVVDFREPDVLRIAACPLYNVEDDVERFARALDEELRAHPSARSRRGTT